MLRGDKSPLRVPRELQKLMAGGGTQIQPSEANSSRGAPGCTVGGVQVKGAKHHARVCRTEEKSFGNIINSHGDVWEMDL